ESLLITVLPRGLPAALLACGLIAATIVALRRDLAALTAYVVGLFVILLFVYLKYSGGMRHHGHVFILLVASLWIARRGVRPVRASSALVLLLTCQLVAGAY